MDLTAILNHIVTFILSLYGNPALPRKIVQEVIDHMDDFISNVYIPSLKNDVLEVLKNENISDTSFKKIEQCFQKHSTVFDNVSTECKRFKILKTKGFIDYEECVIGKPFTEKLVGNEMLMVQECIYGIHVPLRKSLKLFLEIPGLFTQILEYMQLLFKESYVITNIIQADLWLKKYSEKVVGTIVLPLFIFYDDLEVGNPLGSHAGINKFGAVYASIASLPPHIASRLSSILFSTLVHVKDKNKSSNRKVFRKLIEELNFLQSQGIDVNVNGLKHLVKFRLVLILGDNLGLNGIFGLVESFRANYSCRLCKVSSEESSTMVVEDESKLRTRENYDEDVKNADVTKSGIKEACVFHEVDDFHMTENLSVDMMHDILEGVCVYIMRSLIYTFIFVKNDFTLHELNSRVQNFNFGPIESSNKPPSITMNRLKKMNLKLSAAEMLCLVRYFGLIVGHFIPENDEHWELYKILRQIIDIVTSPRIVPSDAKGLKNLIQNLNQIYQNLYDKLKPKFHHLIHYPRILLANGPCINFWSMRFESRHRQLKANAQSTSCSKNLLITIAPSKY